MIKILERHEFFFQRYSFIVAARSINLTLGDISLLYYLIGIIIAQKQSGDTELLGGRNRFNEIGIGVCKHVFHEIVLVIDLILNNLGINSFRLILNLVLGTKWIAESIIG